MPRFAALALLLSAAPLAAQENPAAYLWTRILCLGVDGAPLALVLQQRPGEPDASWFVPGNANFLSPRAGPVRVNVAVFAGENARSDAPDAFHVARDLVGRQRDRAYNGAETVREGETLTTRWDGGSLTVALSEEGGDGLLTEGDATRALACAKPWGIPGI